MMLPHGQGGDEPMRTFCGQVGQFFAIFCGRPIWTDNGIKGSKQQLDFHNDCQASKNKLNAENQHLRKEIIDDYNKVLFNHSSYFETDQFQEELGKLQFYFRKIPLHQQKNLVVSIFLIRFDCQEI